MLFFASVVNKVASGQTYTVCAFFFLVNHCTVLRNSATPLFMIDNSIHLKVDRMLNNRYNTQNAK